MKNLFTQPGGGALGSKGSEDALLGSRENGSISLKDSQGVDFALEDKGALGSNISKDADLGLKNFNGASKTRHSETPKAGSESVTLASNKQTLMSTDDRLTRFGQPQRFALSRVQGDGWSSNSEVIAKHTYSCHCEECVRTTSQSYDIGSRRSRWSLAM
ncbi:hypothetical protein IJ732_05840, partial [bacterium]|nr:hypothetical protein [bacterium]